MTELNEQLAELDAQIQSHPYHEISHRMDEIGIVLEALERNFDLLASLIDEWIEDEDRFFEAPFSERRKVNRELFRRLHNYLATYHTQYEFTKNLRNDTVGREDERYRILIEEHDIRPTSDFLKALRNYAQKREILNVTTSYGSLMDKDREPHTYLSGEDLLELKSSYRNQRAKEFIKSYESDEIALTDVVESHHPNLMAFHDDFRGLILNEYKVDFDEYTTLQSRHTELAKRLYGTD